MIHVQRRPDVDRRASATEHARVIVSLEDPESEPVSEGARPRSRSRPIQPLEVSIQALEPQKRFTCFRPSAEATQVELPRVPRQRALDLAVERLSAEGAPNRLEVVEQHGVGDVGLARLRQPCSLNRPIPRSEPVDVRLARELPDLEIASLSDGGQAHRRGGSPQVVQQFLVAEVPCAQPQLELLRCLSRRHHQQSSRRQATDAIAASVVTRQGMLPSARTGRRADCRAHRRARPGDHRFFAQPRCVAPHDQAPS